MHTRALQITSTLSFNFFIIELEHAVKTAPFSIQHFMSVMHSSIGCAFFSLSHSFIKNGPFVEITLDNRHWVECDDERRTMNTTQKYEMMVNKGTLHSFHILPGMDAVALILFFSIIFSKCCQYIVPALSWLIISLSLSLFFISRFLCSAFCVSIPKFHQRVNKHGHVQHPSCCQR